MTTTYDEMDHSIYKLLRTEGPMATSQLAEQLGEDRAKVYRRLQRIERILSEGDAHYLASRKEEGERKLYWFPLTGDILTARNYELADRLIRELKEIVDEEHIPRGADITDAQKERLLARFSGFVAEWAKRLNEKQREALDKFWAQLRYTMGDTKRSDIVGLFGMRPFRPEVRVWEVAGDAPDDLPST